VKERGLRAQSVAVGERVGGDQDALGLLEVAAKRLEFLGLRKLSGELMVF
jgi:hypothetical protein